jgi:hypothetical protein
VFHGVFALGGPLLLTVLTGGCALAAVLVSWRMMRGSYEWRLGLLLALVVLMPPAWAVRPQALSLLLFMLALHLVLNRRFVWMPILIAVWANAHGVVLFGVVVAAVGALDALLWARERAGRPVVVAMLCAAAPVLSPLGWRYWPRVVQTVFEGRLIGIHEYRSAFELAALPFWAMFVALVFAVTRRARHFGQVDAADRQLALLSGALGFASILAIRNAPFFALAAAPALSRVLSFTTPQTRWHPLGRGAVGLLSIAAMVAIATVAYRWREGGTHLGWRPISASAANAIRSCPGPIFNTYAAGGPLLWFVPEQRVFIDGRVEAYPVALLERSRQADLYGDYQQLFREYRIRCAVVPTDSPMAAALALDSSMETSFSDSQWTVFVVNGTG